MIKWLSRFWWMPLNTVGPCVGLTLFRWFRWKVELWYAPADYAPPEHTHEHSDGEFFVLFGRGRRIFRKFPSFWPLTLQDWDTDEYELTGRQYFKWFTVRASTVHGFSKGQTPMVWLCVEHWKPGVKVTSVADDFVLT